MPNLCSSRPVTLAARLSLTVLAVHIIGVSLVAVVPVPASAASLADLTAVINAEYADGLARTTLALQEAEYTPISWTLYRAKLLVAEGIEAGGDAMPSGVIDAAIADLAEAKAGLVPVLPPTSPVDRSALVLAITEAQAMHDAAIEGSGSGQYAIGSKAMFQSAIDAAQMIHNDPAATQAMVDQAVTDVAAATALFQAAMVTVTMISTTTSLTSSLTPSTVGQSVTFTATVSPAAATGSVTFTAGAMSLGGPVTLSGGVAILTTSTLSAGVHLVTATYGGNTQYAGSASSPFTQTVQQQQQAPVTGGGGGGSGGRRGAGLLSPLPFNLVDTIAPSAFGGLTSWREAVTDRQHRLMCRLQRRLQFHTSTTAFNRISQRLQRILRLDGDMVDGALKETMLCE